MKLIYFTKTHHQDHKIIDVVPKQAKETINNIFSTTTHNTILASYNGDLFTLEKSGSAGEYTKTQIKYHPLANKL